MEYNTLLPMMLFVLGIVFFAVSIFEYFFPSKSRSQKGYRTKRSLYTQESWDFAQKYYAKMVFFCSLLLILLSFAAAFTRLSNTIGALVFAVIVLSLCFLIYFKTEKALREHF